MKLRLLVLIFVCAGAISSAQAPLLTAAIQQEAEKYAKALMANDYAGVLAYTHERIVNKMGGKEAAPARLQKSTEEMKAKGLSVENTRIGTPLPAQKIGTWTVSLVPETLTLRLPGARVEQDSFLLGISTDDGKTWKFIDLGPISEDQLFTVFPELKGQFKMPAKRQALVEKKP